MYVYDVVIIGAGPAGLAAAARIGDETNRFLLMDAGKALEDRDRCDQILLGALISKMVLNY